MDPSISSFVKSKYPVVKVDRKIVREFQRYNVLPQQTEKQNNNINNKDEPVEATDKKQSVSPEMVENMDPEKYIIDSKVIDSSDMQPLVLLERLIWTNELNGGGGDVDSGNGYSGGDSGGDTNQESDAAASKSTATKANQANKAKKADKANQAKGTKAKPTTKKQQIQTKPTQKKQTRGRPQFVLPKLDKNTQKKTH